MAANSSLPPESHYDPKKLDKLFAILAIVLLLSLIAIFAKDYSRQWKNYQRQFRALEVEKAQVKLDEQEGDLSKNEEYQKVLKDLQVAEAKLKQQTSQQKQLNAQISTADAQLKIHVQTSQFAKAQYDALKFRYEKAKNESAPNVDVLKKQLEGLGDKIKNLRVNIENDNAQIKAKQDQLDALQKEVKDLSKKKSTIAKKAEILENKLKRISPEKMSVANQVAEVVRDLPILDLANPNYKVQQIVLKDIPEDVNFMKVQRVDRCTTCHLGIDNPDFKNAPQPFTSHPNLELFMDKNSPHPLEEFGCTSCHQGRGRGTDFVSAAHTPRNEEQKEEWIKKYGWYELHHWDQQMFPAPLTEAGCFKCHENKTALKGAEKLNLGLNLIERAGCYNCHTIKKYQDWPKSGPSLEAIATKSTKDWAFHWIDDPKSIRFNTWMPSFFHQTNNNDPASLKRGQQEVHAIVSYLFANSKPFDVPGVAQEGNATKGKELVSSLGCYACHQIEDKKSDKPRTLESLHREFGPNLIGLGSKTTKEWLFQWLKDPSKYHHDTRMPNMRLSDQEAADISAYLIQDKSAAVGKAVPPVDGKVLDVIVEDFLKKSSSIEDTKKKIQSMSQDEKLLFAGKRLIREYGCYSCHQIAGFENEKPIGAELSEEGSKDAERLDFGFIKIEHSKEAWFKTKLLNPRAFDHGKMVESLDKLKMPNFNLSPEEAEAITTALLGFVKERPTAKLAEQSVKANFINEGAKTIRQLNCQGCHIIDGNGGVIQGPVTDWLVAYQGKDPNDAKAMTRSFSPPDLIGEGQKVQAEWLFEFLHGPTSVRPWLTLRMPTYYFHQGQINSIVKYFNYLDNEEFPFTDIYHPVMTDEELTAAQKLISKDYFDCTKCHVIGNKMPSGSMETWAPNFMLASKRLKPEWIIKWITNPPALLPGTKMPAFYDPKDPVSAAPQDLLGGDYKHQIRALRDYLLTISDHMPAGSAVKEASMPAPAKTETPAKEQAKKPAQSK